MDIQKKFEEIKKEYKSYYDSLLKQGKLLVRDTSKGIWGVAGTDEIFEFFQKIDLKDKKFLDIGSGDGKVVLIASLFCREAVGVEIDEDLVKKALEIRDKLGLKCEFICGDFFENDFSAYDVLFVNPDKGFHEGLEEKLLKEMKGELYVYNFVFQPRFLKKTGKIWVNEVPVSKYSI